MEHRGYSYKEIRVTNWRDVTSTMYQCNDVDLLKHTDVSVFTKFTEKRMKEAIDYYIDNVEYHKSLKPLTEKAVKDFYKLNTIKD
jgi:hypothetical protein